jgi:curli biogenesis system outer membrane secretion channel CsgG
MNQIKGGNMKRISSGALLALAYGLAVVSMQAAAQGVSGGAAGGQAQGADSQLQHCTETFGTLAVVEDQSAPWWHEYANRYPSLGSTIPVLRMMIQQSNCFVVVERGRGMNNVMQERRLEKSGELRGGSNFGGGQMVAADFTMSPSIQFAAKGTGGIGGAIGGILGGTAGRVVGAIGGGLKTNEASTTLLLVENRSSVQIAAAVGAAKNHDFKLGGAAFGGGAGAAAGAFTNTPEGKVITAAFADSFNQMVTALRGYKAQQVKGGLGKGGTLKVGD